MKNTKNEEQPNTWTNWLSKSIFGNDKAYSTIPDLNILQINFFFSVFLALFDFIWQLQMSSYFPVRELLTVFMAHIQFVVPIAMIVIALITLCVKYFGYGDNIENIYGKLVPILSFIVAILFFATVIFPAKVALLLAIFHIPKISILYLSCLLGVVLDTITKSLKYTFNKYFIDISTQKQCFDGNKKPRTYDSKAARWGDRPAKALTNGVICLVVFVFSAVVFNFVIALLALFAVIFWYFAINNLAVENEKYKKESDVSKFKTTKAKRTNVLEQANKVFLLTMLKVCAYSCHIFLFVMCKPLLITILGVNYLPLVSILFVLPLAILWTDSQSQNSTQRCSDFYKTIRMYMIAIACFAIFSPSILNLHNIIPIFSFLPHALANIIHNFGVVLFFLLAELWGIMIIPNIERLSPSLFAKDEITSLGPWVDIAVNVLLLMLTLLASKFALFSTFSLLTTLKIIVAFVFCNGLGIMYLYDKTNKHIEFSQPRKDIVNSAGSNPTLSSTMESKLGSSMSDNVIKTDAVLPPSVSKTDAYSLHS